LRTFVSEIVGQSVIKGAFRARKGAVAPKLFDCPIAEFYFVQLAQNEESRRPGGEAKRGGRMGQAETALILKRASASRSSGEWNDDDFDVLATAKLSAASSR
jgi:hypothetical protein